MRIFSRTKSCIRQGPSVCTMFIPGSRVAWKSSQKNYVSFGGTVLSTYGRKGQLFFFWKQNFLFYFFHAWHNYSIQQEIISFKIRFFFNFGSLWHCTTWGNSGIFVGLFLQSFTLVSFEIRADRFYVRVDTADSWLCVMGHIFPRRL